MINLTYQNQYTNITEYYDLWVTSGYYDYQVMAQAANRIIGNGRKIIELGVGTGLLAQKYLEIDPSCGFTGVDFTASMLEIAQKRVGAQVKLIEADVVNMNLKQKFEVAISNGGVWGILDLGDRWEFGGHVPGVDANAQGLENLANHLQEDGLLLLHLQRPHKTYDKLLAEGIVYSQSIEEIEDTKNYHTLLKSYLFKKDGKILAQEQITITCFKPDTSKKLLSEAGFELQGTSDDDKFAIYQKK
ncbi:MAG: class I SAM-dependent methyltransferase [Cyanobacteria bacterium P01_G01_bin.39]